MIIALLQWQCMEQAGVQDEVLDRIRDIQLSMQSGHIEALESSSRDRVQSLCKQLVDGQLSDVTACASWLCL